MLRLTAMFQLLYPNDETKLPTGDSPANRRLTLFAGRLAPSLAPPEFAHLGPVLQYGGCVCAPHAVDPHSAAKEIP